MSSNDHPRAFLFKTTIAAGVALGIILLAQTIWSYLYVSQTLIIQEAQNDAMRKAQSIAATTRDLDPKDTPLLTEILNDRLDDWKEQVAWIQLMDAKGLSLAAAGTIPKDKQLPTKRPAAAKANLPDQESADTDEGRVVIVRIPLARSRPTALGAGPSSAGSVAKSPANGAKNPPTSRAEVAVYVDSITRSFTFLLRYLIVGVSASLALMGSLVFISVRFNRYVRGQQIEGQLDLARRVQNDMLPSRGKTLGRIEFATDCIPAWDVGGDYCDVFAVGGGRTAFILGDISGKGISAALLMALIHGAIQSISWTRSKADHEQASRSLNALLCRKTAKERFSSLFWGYFDPESSVLHYVNAGHPPPLLLRRGADGEIDVLRLESGGPVLGLLPEGEYCQGEQPIVASDLLVAFSDGIVEAPNRRNEEFGELRLISVVADIWSSSPEIIRDAVLSAVRGHTQDAPVADDQTLIVVRFNGPQCSADVTN